MQHRSKSRRSTAAQQSTTAQPSLVSLQRPAAQRPLPLRKRRALALLLVFLLLLPLAAACRPGGAAPADAPASDGQPQPGGTPSNPGTPSQSGEPLPFPVGAEADPAHVFDIVITGGRIMDPETGFDRIGNVGIDGDRITAITDKPIQGRKTIGATGLVVSPGFVDILSYDPNDLGIWYKIADGVTTNLGMHGLSWDADSWFRYWSKNPVPPAHFGGAFSILRARERLGLGVYQQATPAQRELLVQMFEQSLHDGYIGIDLSPEYAPGITYEDIKALATVAAKYDVPVFFHVRYSSMVGPGTNIDAVNEVIQTARDTGASVHIEHINSTGGTFSMAESLALIEAARAEGLDITACIYPYNYWATYLASTRFDPGWQERFNITYSDLEIPALGERLTAETFEKYRKTNMLAVAYAIPEEDVRLALQQPYVMIGSDSILEPGLNDHPRAAGTFARTLGYYVREEQLISLMDALAKMTIMPVQKLEKQVPALQKKGRLQLGMDADITVFNPDTIADRATVANPAQESVGIEWVLVMGQIVKTPDGLNKDVRAGQPIKLEPKHPRPAPPVLPTLQPPAPPAPPAPPPGPPDAPDGDEPPACEPGPDGQPDACEPSSGDLPGDGEPPDGEQPPDGEPPDGEPPDGDPPDGEQPPAEEQPPGDGSGDPGAQGNGDNGASDGETEPAPPGDNNG